MTLLYILNILLMPSLKIDSWILISAFPFNLYGTVLFCQIIQRKARLPQMDSFGLEPHRHLDRVWATIKVLGPHFDNCFTRAPAACYMILQMSNGKHPFIYVNDQARGLTKELYTKSLCCGGII